MHFNSRYQTFLAHAAIWASFIAYEVYVALMLGSKASVFDFACFYALNISLFYFHAQVGGPFAAKRKYAAIAFILVLLIELVSYDALSIGLDIIVSSIEKEQLNVEIYKQDYIRGLWRGMYFLGLSTGYYFGLRSVKNLKLKLQGERRESALENAHLRAQINSHLLFNMLGFFHGSVIDVAPEVAKGTTLLINSLRYAMLPTQRDGFVDLQLEIEQIERLIQMNQLLASNRLFITKEVSPECYTADVRVPPLLLFTFIENMFKHGDLTDTPGLISLETDSHSLHLHTENLRANMRRFRSEKIGLNNATARLEKYYGGNFVLASFENEGTFIVDLKLKL